MREENALDEIGRNAGTQLDPDIGRTFLALRRPEASTRATA